MACASSSDSFALRSSTVLAGIGLLELAPPLVGAAYGRRHPLGRLSQKPHWRTIDLTAGTWACT